MVYWTPPESQIAFPGDHTYNGDDTDGARTFSEGEGDTSRATDPDSSALSPTKKEKKKKSGLRNGPISQVYQNRVQIWT